MDYNLFISGGAFRISGLVGSSEAVIERFGMPKMIAGTSSGALMTMMIALGKQDKLKELATSVKLSDVFTKYKSPFTEKGNFNILSLRFLPYGWLGDNSELLKTYKRHINSNEYYEAQRNENIPECKILVYNASSNQIETFSSKDVSYDSWCLAVIASCTIPFVMKPVKIGNQYYFDGGVVSFMPHEYLSKQSDYNKILAIKIYSRSSRSELFSLQKTGIINMIKWFLSIGSEQLINAQKESFVTDDEINIVNHDFTKKSFSTDSQLIMKNYENNYFITRNFLHSFVELIKQEGNE